MAWTWSLTDVLAGTFVLSVIGCVLLLALMLYRIVRQDFWPGGPAS